MRKLSDTFTFISLPNRRQSRAESTKSSKSVTSSKTTHLVGYRPPSPHGPPETPPYTPQYERPFSFFEAPEFRTSVWDAQAAPFSAFAEDDRRLSVIVVGAGFAGLSAAIACARQGYKVTVFERSTGLSRHGDVIALGANAVRVLRRWSESLFQDLHSESTKGEWWNVMDKHGHLLHQEDLKYLAELYGAPMVLGSRATYLGMLGTEARLHGVDIRYGVEIVKYIDSRMSPSIVTAAGEHVFCDVIIAADGTHSKAQRQLTRTFADSDSSPVEEVSGMDFFKAPYCVHRAMVSSEAIKACKKTAYLCDGNTRTWCSEESTLSISSFGHGEKISFMYERRDITGTASRDWRARRPVETVLEDMAGWEPSAIEAVRLFKTCLEWPCSDELPVPDWVSRGGKIVMIGDAIHAMCPSSFQGGSQSIEDGATIAICLAMSDGNRAGVARALKAFARLRRKRIVRAQKVGIEQRELWHSRARSVRLNKPVPPGSPWMLFPEAFDHDAELDTVGRYEDIVKGFDPLWKPDPVLKARVRAKIVGE